MKKSPQEESAEKVVIHADMEGNGTKVGIDGTTGAFTWTRGDRIAVYSSKWFTSDGLSEAGPTADFAFTGLVDANREWFAVYPASSAGAVSAGSLTVSYPAEFYLTSLNSEEVPMVMVAQNEPGQGLSFKHVGAILRLTVKDVPYKAYTLTVDFLDKKVTGNFTVAGLDSEPFIPTVSVADGTSSLVFHLPSALSEMGDVVLNIPVPTGNLGRIKVSATDVNGIPFTNPLTIAGPSLQRAHGKRMDMYLPSFSVSATRKVIFAPGNLQATTTDGSTWTWHFAAHQYDYVGSAAANTTINGKGTSSTAGTVDLFGWSTANTKYGIWNNNTSSNYTGDLVEWGTLEIDAYPANTWRTIQGKTATSADTYQSLDNLGELQYIIHKRPASTVGSTENARFIKCKLENGTYGLVLFPDHYVHPTGQALVEINLTAKAGQSGNNVITMENWALMEAAGCVFLPYSGQRTGGTSIGGANGRGEYWTGTPYVKAEENDQSVADDMVARNANRLYVNSEYFRVAPMVRCYGAAVRLVRDVTGESTPDDPASHPISGQSQLGCYGVGSVNMVYRPGADQWSWTQGISSGTFRLLDQEHGRVLVLSSLPLNPSVGDSFQGHLVLYEGPDAIQDTHILLKVVNVDENTFWLEYADDGTGLVIKKRTL